MATVACDNNNLVEIVGGGGTLGLRMSGNSTALEEAAGTMVA
eukprot:CAMPEP_0116856556 /NCGR_PEP_ID=MMETSP0418-20121206/19986_1 /TAXON_ID=1158023 /ORGANISM="Astrosyne radiata, Strain 13vi08-1A" /LENGTH=41 /DNA_ID= /DNA_START= /DNA_END= /DNA_ORIENTATION=